MFLVRTQRPAASSAITVALVFAAGIGVGAMLAPGSGQPIAARAAPAKPAVIAAAMRTAYPAEVVRVVDGDTFEARVRVWPAIEIATKVRLRDIDAPEMRGRCEQELVKARAARDALVAMLAQGEVRIGQVGLDKYGGRVLASVATRDVDDVSAALFEAGLVRRYAGGRREPWCL